MDLVTEKASFLARIVWSDETIFELNGHVDRHDSVYYAVHNPHVLDTQETNAPGITTWAGITSGAVIDPLFFRNTVTTNNHLETLKKEMVRAIESQTNLRKMYYLHGAPAHHAQPLRASFDDKFRDRFLNRRAPFDGQHDLQT